MKVGKYAIWRVAKYALALGLSAAVISEVSVEAISELWKDISVSWFLVSVCAFYASIWFMALRYWVLIDAQTEFTNVLAAVLYQTIISNLLTTIAGVAWY